MGRIKNFFNDESGASAVEYGLLVALIAVVIIGAVTAVGTSVKSKLNAAATAMGGTAGE
jgi:pilus assembly protein Flp/PilA